jgi:UDP-N-acetylmuramoylalanine--D-glutamate ligase
LLNFRGKKIAVLGLARSGIAAAKLAAKMGAKIILSDSKTKVELGDKLKEIKNKNIEIETGGHSEKILKGTDLIILSPGIEPDIPVLKKATLKGIPVLSEVEIAWQLLKTPLIAITGTNGKTTTTTLIGEIIKNSGREVQVAGNIGTPLTSIVGKISSRGIVVAEISSFQLETIDKFKPWISLILNITPDHLDRYPNMNEYIKAKERVFENQDAENFLILNADDPLASSMAGKAKCRVVFFSRRKKLKQGIFVKDNNIISLLDDKPQFSCPVDSIKLPGPHNLENVLAAVAAALLSGVVHKAIKKTISSFNGVEHRLELIGEIEGVKFFNDSKATNVDSTLKALESFQQPIILIAGGRDKGSPYLPLKDLVAQKVKALVLLGEAAGKIKRELENYSRVYMVRDLKDAVQTSARLAVKGDIVLLSPACSSYDMFKNYEQRGREFKKFVREIIQ